MPVISTNPTSTPAPTPSSNAASGSAPSGSAPSGSAPSGSDTPAPTDPAPTPAPADTFESTSTRSQRKIAERALARAGHNPGPVDGTFGTKTRKSLKDFQKGLGLPQTGELDEKTYGKLKSLSTKLKNGSKTLQPGMKSSKIKTAEKQLKRLGYDTGAVDGLYTQRTADAVKALRADQKNLAGNTGNIGAHGLKVLDKEVKELFHQPWRTRVKNTAAHKAADKRATKAAEKDHANGSEGMGVGSKGRSVAYIKQHLRAAGYDPQTTSETFDERTEGMVKEFQRKSKLPVTGRVDTRTWRSLRKAKMESTSGTSPSQRKGERSAAVKRTEKLLKSLGYNPGSVDGLYTAQTQKAVERFRKAYAVGGKGNGVGENTLRALRKAENGTLLKKGQLVTGFVRGVPRKIRVVTVDGKKMERTTAAAYLRMKRSAAKAGIHLQLNSGWRSNAEQSYLYNGWIQRRPGFNLAAPPGYSNHQSGAAVDLQVSLGGGPSVGVGSVYNWLANNAPKFGFQRIAAEAWHWEYQPLLRKYS